MNLPNFSDLQINFQTLNFLHASLQGRFAQLNLLSQTNHPSFRQETLNECKEDLKKTRTFFNEVNKNSKIYITRTGSLTAAGEEGEIFRMLAALEMVYKNLSRDVEQVLGDPSWKSRPSSIFELIASFAFQSYYNDNFYKKLIEHQLATLGQSDPALEKRRKEAEEAIRITSSFLTTASDPAKVNDAFCNHLNFFAKNLPGAFRVHHHELRQLLSVKEPAITFTLVGFNPEEELLWKDYSPVEAGYWRAHGFSPESALPWKKVGIVDASIAAEWLRSGFTPEQSIFWLRLSFTSLLAIQWHNAGFSPDQAMILISSGYNLPNQLPKTKEEVIELIKTGAERIKKEIEEKQNKK